MKNLIIGFVFVVVSFVNGFAYETVFRNYKNDNFKDEINQFILEQYIDSVVPEQFVQDFKDNSIYQKNLDDIPYRKFAIICLGVADIESLRWQIMKSKPNRDGSVDYGPMGMNGNNIKDKKFIQYFAPDNYKNMEKNNFYMVTCMNFLRSLIKEKSIGDSLIIYNGGWKALRAKPNTPLYRKTRSYRDKVLNRIKFHLDNINDYYDNNFEILLQEKIEENQRLEELNINNLIKTIPSFYTIISNIDTNYNTFMSDFYIFHWYDNRKNLFAKIKRSNKFILLTDLQFKQLKEIYIRQKREKEIKEKLRELNLLDVTLGYNPNRSVLDYYGELISIKVV